MSSDTESKEEKFVKKPTSSETFFTPEERQLRKQYRMGKSVFCLRESWKLYNKLTDSNRDYGELETTSSVIQRADDTVILHSPYDPRVDKRQLFLQNKFKYIHDGISLTIQAPEKPYLLTLKTRDLDAPGRRYVLPRAIRATRAEVFIRTAPPFESTYAYTKQWMNVSNLNFEVVRTMIHASTQTDTDLMLLPKIIRISLASSATQGTWNVRTLIDNNSKNRPERRTALIGRELARYNIDIAALSETRLAGEGNLCEKGAGYTFYWSGRGAEDRREAGVGFAIKTSLIGKLTEPPNGINDRLMTVKILCSMGDLQVDLMDIPLDADGNPIGKRTGFCEWCGMDILPIPTPRVLAKIWDRRHLYCCETYRQLVEEVNQIEKRLLDDKKENELLVDVRHKVKAEETSSDATAVDKKALTPRRMSQLNKWLQIALAQRKGADSMALTVETTRDQCVDTSDLMWDPFETRFSKPRPYNDVVFDDAIQHVYRHAEIVLHQAEIYAATETTRDLADLATDQESLAE